MFPYGATNNVSYNDLKEMSPEKQINLPADNSPRGILVDDEFHMFVTFPCFLQNSSD